MMKVTLSHRRLTFVPLISEAPLKCIAERRVCSTAMQFQVESLFPFQCKPCRAPSLPPVQLTFALPYNPTTFLCEAGKSRGQHWRCGAGCGRRWLPSGFRGGCGRALRRGGCNDRCSAHGPARAERMGGRPINAEGLDAEGGAGGPFACDSDGFSCFVYNKGKNEILTVLIVHS
jgi:hypothetical protein